MNVSNIKTFISRPRMNVFSAETAMPKTEILFPEAQGMTLMKPSETASEARGGTLMEQPEAGKKR
ncbi:MAG: hypothetical protein LBD24_00400 [Spirochaetaceae bacterium]|nr:hypothetical protein [Spirochaetaceae bacterium]